jgi:1,4-dihydroxy-2-naphthoate polyprenyltransferase
MKSWWLAFRPKTLTAAVVPILVGTSLVYFSGYEIQWWVSLCALAACLCIQIATNLMNDAIDFKKGADTHERVGPKRVSQSGLIQPRTVMLVAILFLFFAFLFGIPLVIQGGWPIVVIGTVSLFLAYSYTGGPFPLAYLGLGDLFVVLFFGVIAVMGLYYLHTLIWSADALVAGLQVGFLATVLIAVNNFRDVKQDIIANKKTLAVRFGPSFVRFEIIALIVGAFLLNFYWSMIKQSLLAASLPFFILPLALLIVANVTQLEPSDKMNKVLAQSAALHIGFGAFLSLGLILTVIL